MGASIQMAYSLGLHRNQTPDSSTSLEREQYRRIWWTLFTLEQEVASRGGSPTLVDERLLKIDTPLPSEQVALFYLYWIISLILRRSCTPGCTLRYLGYLLRSLCAG